MSAQQAGGAFADEVRLVAEALQVHGLAGGDGEAPALSDVELEQCALVAMLALPEVIRDHIAVGLQPTDFVVPAHQLLYAALVRLWDTPGATIDAITLHHALRGQPTYEQIGGRAYLFGLLDGCFVVALNHSPRWAHLLHELAMRRKLAGLGPAFRTAATDAPDLQAAIADAQERLARAVLETGVLTSSPHPADILAAAENHGPALPVPWDPLNYYTGGLRPGEVWTIIGTSSHGKTAFVLNIARDVLRAGGQVAYVNLDSASVNVLYRLIALEAGVDKEISWQRRPVPTAASQAAWAARELLTVGDWSHQLRVYRDDREMARILATARRHKSERGIDLLVVDFIQNVTLHGVTNEYEIINTAMVGFQQFAQTQDTTVLLLSQVSIEHQKGQRMADAVNAKGSGAVKDNSDICLGLYRDRFAEGEEKRHLDVTVLKTKERPTGKVALKLDLEVGRVTTREDRYQSQDYAEWAALERRR